MFENFLSEHLSIDQNGPKRKPLARNKSSYCINYPFVYFFGGRRNNICLKDFWCFNFEKKNFEEVFIEDMPLFEDHATCFYQDKLYIFGGQFGVCQSTFLSWREGSKRFKLVKHHGRPPPNYRGHTMIAHGLCLYVFGGWNEEFGASKMLWKYNTSLKTWTTMKPSGNIPCRRYDHSCVVFNDSMWIYGGTDQLHNRCSDLWRYNFNLNCWNQVKSKISPPALCCHSAVVCKNFMLICGGKTVEDGQNSDLWSFSFTSLTWKRLGTIEAILRCNLNVCDMLSLKINHINDATDIGNENKYGSNFVRSINGNPTQKSADSGYSDTKMSSSSQESLISDKARKLIFVKHSATNLGFINDDYNNVPGYIADSIQPRKYASTLAIPTKDHLTNHDNGIELTEFPRSANKKIVKNKTYRSTVDEENDNKILFIGRIFDLKPDISMCTLCFN